MKKIIVGIIDNVIFIALLAIGLVIADANLGLTSPVEMKPIGISMNLDTGFGVQYQSYRDPQKSIGYEIYNEYWLPVLSEIEEAF